VHGATQSYLAASWLSNCYEMLDRPDDAQRALRQTMEATLEVVRRSPGPETAHARTLLGITLIQAGQAEAGFAQIERALELQPGDGRIHYNAACAFARTGQTDRALHELREGTKNISSYTGDWPLRDPDMKNLWDNPEFIRMFGKVEKA
jgi:predicted Zn-dependent protease